MWKNILIIGGIIFFLGGLSGSLAIMYLISNGTANATALDYTPSSGFGTCPIVRISAQLSSRVMSESDTQALTVTVLNYCSSPQSVTVDLNAPEFSFSPSESDRTVTAIGSTNIDWILIPHKLGTFAIVVSLGSYTVILGVTVVNVFGLTLWETQLLSYITPFLGPILMFAWWSRRRKDKKRKSEEARLAGSTTKKAKPNKKEYKKPFSLFYCYDPADSIFRDKLHSHLSSLEHAGWIKSWFDGMIKPGVVREEEIRRNLETADIILLLVSANFLASTENYNNQMKRAIERHNAKQAVVIPIILRPTLWDETPFASLQPLPSQGKPVSTWSPQDSAFLDIARGISAIVESLFQEKAQEATNAD